jgi:hypothetical protein
LPRTFSINLSDDLPSAADDELRNAIGDTEPTGEKPVSNTTIINKLSCLQSFSCVLLFTELGTKFSANRPSSCKSDSRPSSVKVSQSGSSSVSRENTSSHRLVRSVCEVNV